MPALQHRHHKGCRIGPIGEYLVFKNGKVLSQTCFVFNFDVEKCRTACFYVGTRREKHRLVTAARVSPHVCYAPHVFIIAFVFAVTFASHPSRRI